MSKTSLLAVLTVLFTCGIATAQAPPDQEEITLSTYYPAPYGEYDELCAEKLLVWSPISTELAYMGLGDCHIGYSLIVGKGGGGTNFSYGEIGSGQLRDGEVLIKGYLGIGTTFPQQKLHIQDSDVDGFVMRVDKAATGRASLIEFQNSTDNLFGYVGLLGTTGGIMVQGSDASGTDPLFRIQTNAGEERFRVTADGNVGIGMTNPSEELVVRSTTGPNSNILVEDSNGTGDGIYLGFNSAGGYGDISHRTGGTLYLDTIVLKDGYVGMGTTDPGAPLTIKADNNTTMALQLIDRNFNAVASISWFAIDLTTEEARINNYQSNLRFYTGGSFGSPPPEAMRITAGGNVGIGTTNPGYKLSVDGATGNPLDLLHLRSPNDSGRNLRIRYNDEQNRWEVLTDALSGIFFNQVIQKGGGGFDISHPDPIKEKEGWRLRHSFVEGPTRGDNLYRWTVEVKDGEATIELPDYFRYLNENVQVWVSPKRHFGRAYGEADTELIKIIVKADSDGAYNVLAMGTRKDRCVKDWFDKLGVEYQATAK